MDGSIWSGPPREIAGPGAKIFPLPLRRHFSQTAENTTQGKQYSKALQKKH